MISWWQHRNDDSPLLYAAMRGERNARLIRLACYVGFWGAFLHWVWPIW